MLHFTQQLVLIEAYVVRRRSANVDNLRRFKLRPQLIEVVQYIHSGTGDYVRY